MPKQAQPHREIFNFPNFGAELNVANGCGVTFVPSSHTEQWPLLRASLNEAAGLKSLWLQMWVSFSMNYRQRGLSSSHVYLISWGGTDAAWRPQPALGCIDLWQWQSKAAKKSSEILHFCKWDFVLRSSNGGGDGDVIKTPNSPSSMKY